MGLAIPHIEAVSTDNRTALLDGTTLTLTTRDGPAGVGAGTNADPTLASIQTPALMLADTTNNMHGLHRLADRLYAKWLEGVTSANGVKEVSRGSC